MHFNVANRRIHHWASFAASIPLIVIIGSGVVLQLKKHWTWVQPAEQRGSTSEPQLEFPQMLDTLRTLDHLGVSGWTDVDRLDVRPSRGVVKVLLENGWEVQLDLGTGRVLQTAYRRSDVIEAIHDGSLFFGDLTKLGLFLPAGLVLLLLWLSGVWMIWVQFVGKRRRRRLREQKATIVILPLVLTSAALAGQTVLSVDPLVGHWETVEENGRSVVRADAGKWARDDAATPFPVAAVRGVDSFSEGVVAVKFKMIGGESDQIAGLAFDMRADGTYYYVRYNTKDGNVALWRFEGDRRRIAEGSQRLPLPLDQWHELRLEVHGTRIVATVNDRLTLEHALPAPVAGRVGFWTKRDSVTAFTDFVLRRAR